MSDIIRPDPFPDSHTLILSSSELGKSPWFPSLIEMINEAFSNSLVIHHEATGEVLLPFGCGRFTKPQDMLDELGSNAFCLVMFEDSSMKHDQILATISVKPFEQTKEGKNAVTEDGHARLLFKRPPPTSKSQESSTADTGEDSMPKYELISSAASLKVRGKGAGSKILDECLAELIRRERSTIHASDSYAANTSMNTAQSDSETGSRSQNKFLLYVSTMKVINESYYQRKGWTSTAVREFPPGTAGSPDGFVVVEMSRVIQY